MRNYIQYYDKKLIHFYSKYCVHRYLLLVKWKIYFYYIGTKLYISFYLDKLHA